MVRLDRVHLPTATDICRLGPTLVGALAVPTLVAAASRTDQRTAHMVIRPPLTASRCSTASERRMYVPVTYAVHRARGTRTGERYGRISSLLGAVNSPLDSI